MGWASPTHGLPIRVPNQEMKTSVKVSVAMKMAKTIQYIIHRTCGSECTELSLGAGGAKARPRLAQPSPEIPESLSHHIAACPRVCLGRSP